MARTFPTWTRLMSVSGHRKHHPQASVGSENRIKRLAVATESIYSYGGIRRMNTLIVGPFITGASTFV
jgi:hypothetical protein